MSSCNRREALSREAYEKMKRDAYDAVLDAEYERKPAFANASDSDAKENMAADSFANEGVERSNEGVTCGTCAECHDPLWRICTDYDDGMANTTCISSVKATTEACGNYRPRTDSLENVARAMWILLDTVNREYNVPEGRTGVIGKCDVDYFKQRLHECGIEVE